MSRRKLAWVIPFLSVTGLAIAGELYAAFDGNPDTAPWTDLIVRYIPAPITYALIGILITWLPAHFLTHYADAKRRHTAAALVAPTQTRYPWRATLRTVLAAAVAALPVLPDIAHQLHVDQVPIVVRVLVVAAAVTRLLAMPKVDAILRQYLPWLGSAPVPTVGTVVNNEFDAPQSAEAFIPRWGGPPTSAIPTAPPAGTPPAGGTPPPTVSSS